MKLDRVSIKNYRSIKELDLNFDPACKVLVGINESGKSNILRALELLDTTVQPTKKDLRDPVKSEKQPTEAYVRFIFKFGAKETAEIFGILKPKVLAAKITEPIINWRSRDLSLEEFCTGREGLYITNLMNSTKHFSVWTLVGGKILGSWKSVAEACPADFTVSNSKGEVIKLKEFTIVNIADFKDIPTEYIQDLEPEDLNDFVGDAIRQGVEDNLPSVLFWDYNDSKLLPPKINLKQFCDNPDVCIPLKRMFNLNGIWTIKKEVEAAQQGNANTLRNLLRRIADTTTKHFHKTWKEYDDIKFSLAVDGDDIAATIEDKSNHYELSQRSDGFKRFVTFLLLVSAEAETEILQDTLLLIDEPEIGLHPTGTRYLRDELIKISKDNQVVFSTHSIFMIDNRLVRRHLIVKKENEITQVEEVSESNIQDEEVIYKSLGYSIFSNLKEKNLIFEGWRDKKLFEVAMTRVPATHSQIKVPLKATGHCFSQGVKQIENITPLFEAGERMCLILSDNDAMAQEKQKRYRAEKGYGVWRRYDEVVAGSAATTGEDFIKEAAFAAEVVKLQTKHSLATGPTLTDSKGKIYAIKQWLSSNGVAKDDVDTAITEVKEEIFSNLKLADIEPAYYDYLAGVAKEVEALK
ncbi:MAG TPA: AAA family ATPase [Candidatus Paceibacterota bacterium]